MNALRVKRLVVAPELIMLLASGKCEVAANPLPIDAKLNRAFYDEKSRSFVVVVQSQMFDEVEWGTEIPLLEPPIIRRLE
jgi:hypothetical protein